MASPVEAALFAAGTVVPRLVKCLDYHARPINTMVTKLSNEKPYAFNNGFDDTFDKIISEPTSPPSATKPIVRLDAA